MIIDMKKKSIILLFVFTLILGLTGCDETEDVIIEVDKQIADEERDDVSDAEEEILEIEDANIAGELYFETEDILGNTVTSEDFSGSKLIMLNFWEPWCGPCVGEMPGLEEIYQKYKDKGFIILGAFGTPGEDESVMEVIEETGVSYPIIRATESMIPYMTEYVPTTIFLDGDGNVIGDEPVVGSMSEEDWDEIIGDMIND